MPPDSAAVGTLNTSQDPDQLVNAAQVLAAATDSESHKILEGHLKSAAFLERIDPPGVAASSRLHLRIWKPLRTLSENSAPAAKATLGSLTQCPLYVQNIDRTDLLLEASVTLRPPGPTIEKFWMSYSAPGLHAPVLQRVLLDNGSEEALRIFGKMMADQGFPPTQRCQWLRSRLPRYRNEVPYLAMANRLIAGRAVCPDVRIAAVDAVFDWDDEWGPTHGPGFKRPPPRASAGRPARDLVREIARTARAALSIPSHLDAKIDGVLKELDALDAAQTKPKA